MTIEHLHTRKSIRFIFSPLVVIYFLKENHRDHITTGIALD